MTGEDDLISENNKLKQQNQNMGIFISNVLVGLETIARTLSIESGTIFSTVEQIKSFQKTMEQKKVE